MILEQILQVPSSFYAEQGRTAALFAQTLWRRIISSSYDRLRDEERKELEQLSSAASRDEVYAYLVTHVDHFQQLASQERNKLLAKLGAV